VTTGRLFRDKQRGLTLLELLVVVALLGLVTGTVTVRLGGTLSPAALGQAISQWQFADEQLRVRARRSGRPVTLHLEIGSHRLECAFDSDPDAGRVVRSLGRGVRLTKYVSAMQEVTYGPLSIHYDERGASEMFAVEFTGGQSARRWMLVAGLTGQVTEVTDESAAKEILESVSPPRVHPG
jgi:prepilin-type N-terminal cleavage/methylation domain-containing protein